MPQPKALKLALLLHPSSVPRFLHPLPYPRNFPRSGYTRHLCTYGGIGKGLKSVFVATTSNVPPNMTYLRMDGSLISRYYSTSSKNTKGQHRQQRLLEDDSPGSINSRVPVVKLGLGALAMTVGGYFLYHSKERKSPIKARKTEPSRVDTTSQKGTIGGPFKLVNDKGELVTDRDLAGKWTLLYFGYTSSPDICPEELQKLVDAVEKIEKQTNQEIVPVFITIDPERDSVAQIEAYIAEFHPKMVGLTGTVDAVRQVAREYRVYYKKIEEDGSDYLVDHSNVVYLLSPNMEFVKLFGKEYDADSLAAEVVEEIKKRENLGSHDHSRRENE